ncbi:MAG: cell division protein ZapA [Firmicutes bacterium]|nr:cell division protein ZapA [Bacillota bacterium]
MSLSERNKVKVRICNQEYVFLSPAEPEHLQHLARLVDERIHEFMQRDSRLGIAQAAIMAAITFADSMLTTQEKADQLQAQLEAMQSEQANLETQLKRAKAKAAKRAKRKGRR